MDTSSITLAAIVLVPVLLLMFFRVNAVLVFLSICLGSVLVQFVAPDASSMLGLFSKSSDEFGGSTLKLVLLLLPVVLTTVFMLKTVHKGLKLALNFFPALGAGLLLTLLLVPLLPVGLSGQIQGSELWKLLFRLEDLVIGVSALLCLFVLWSQRPNSGEAHEKHHKS